MTAVSGKVVIVTGAAGGLGRVLTAHLASCGATIAACDVDPAVGEVTAGLAATGADVFPLLGDVSNAADVRRTVDAVVARSGRVDVLINNAAVYRATEPTDPWEQAVSDFDAVIGPNLLGAFLFGRAVAPLMASAGSGDIVNVSTDHVHNCGWPRAIAHDDAEGCPWSDARRPPGAVGMDLYDASKWALNGLTQNWARALRAHDVRVNALCIGSIDSPMKRSYAGYAPDDVLPPEVLARWVDPVRVAEVLVELLAEGPRGRSGENVGIWKGHPAVLPASDPSFAVAPGFEPGHLLRRFT
jgi:3-oxoacyl-[acyl-carrier protein] reductase